MRERASEYTLYYPFIHSIHAQVSLRNHVRDNTHLTTRLDSLKGRYTTRILLTHVDMENPEAAINDITRLSLLCKWTVILCWRCVMCVRVCVALCVHLHVLYMPATLSPVLLLIYSYTHTHTHTYIHTYIYIHTHTAFERSPSTCRRTGPTKRKAPS
jgi:hypothetical protein